MMRVSQFHKNKGDQVENYSPLFHPTYDNIYAFSIFDFTPKHYVTKDMICGGTGFNIKAWLPKEIEKEKYDWSLFPDCDYSLIWFSVGCCNNCSFCVVREKEGYIRPVKPKNLNPNGKYIKVCDNNFFGNPDWKDLIRKLREWGQPVDIQGVDVRQLTTEKLQALKLLRHEKQIHIAWDNLKQDLTKPIKKLTSIISTWKIMCYVLIGYDSTHEQDMYRINQLKGLKVDPFVMPFNKSDPYQKAFARWVNNKAVFRTTDWEGYKYNLKNVEKFMSKKIEYNEMLVRRELLQYL